MNKAVKILWVDDEIELLKPHILFLQSKKYMVDTANSGTDAIEMVKANYYDIVLLDENMPGMSGLQTLSHIKNLRPEVPVVMITKSEEELIMDKAIGSKISDYLIKPVNPNQILLSIKKNTEHKRLITEKTTSDYQSEFRQIGLSISDSMNYRDWENLYRKLVHWEIELAASGDNTMDEILKMQKNEANTAFSKFIKKNYFQWFSPQATEKPVLSASAFKSKVFNHISNEYTTVLLLIDNLRFDQWKIIMAPILEFYTLETEDLYYSILPTATQYARNAFFSGLMPSEIERLFPDLWVAEEEEGGKNLFEESLLQKQLQRLGFREKFYFEKILSTRSGRKITDNMQQVTALPLSVIIVNFVDMMSHARTEMEMIRELSVNEAAYRSLTLSWFEHSGIFELLKYLSSQKVKLIITTDHGAIRVSDPVKVIGDKATNTNLRFKLGKNLGYNPKEVFAITDPAKAYLPKSNLSSTYIFTSGSDFFAYPNNYNYYVNYYKDTFQHGGISLEEMLIPLVVLNPKNQ